MAEKYGTKPKMFTSDWWEYFWMYYKWHTLVILFIILVTAVTIHSKLTAEKYDLTLTYAGSRVQSLQVCDEIEEVLSPICPDVDKNGKGSICYSQLNTGTNIDPEQEVATNMKLQISLAEDATFIFILDKETADNYSGEDAASCPFAPLSDWSDAEIPKDKTYSAHGVDYGISMSEVKLFENSEADFSDCYLFIRYYPRKDQLKDYLDGYKGAIELANNMISQQK